MALNHHDQEIVDLYHEGSTDEPPPRLDAAILSAAREALAASPTPSAAQRKTGWWKRFSVPAQFAVSFMLVAMLSILLTREADVPPMPNREKAESVAPAGNSVEQAAPVMLQSESAVEPPAASPQAKRPALSESRAKTEAAKEPPQQRKMSALRADSAQASAPQSPLAAPVTESFRSQDAAEISPPMPAMAPAPQAVAKPARKAEPMASVAKENRAVQRSVKDWLDEMTVLLDQGRIVEARRLAEAFQKAYPDEVLPDNLKKRLAP